MPKRERLNKRTIISAFMILITIPATILIGIYLFNDRRYYFISVMLIIQTMIPFFLIFEGRKPQARELVLLASISAIAVAGRSAFFWLPQFKPVVAIVIIAGVCLGPEAGFLTGALSFFVSNFFFGQGPWTPWQMFSGGIIGFLAGILVKKRLLPKKRLPLCIYGGLATYFIYGGLINICSVFMFSQVFSWKVLAAAYISAIPFDLIHTLSTIVFLFVLSRPMIEKIERIKQKYGLLEP
ncbi:ECF transporter S component [Anaerocolumna sp.]|uniref:ECF transporter S component n=1 Tax=Anaerocolumna sp. TaxID=2041569 RepID=UPI0028B129C3|nr:ECF transporter S component [Anaerocolumna sp.]